MVEVKDKEMAKLIEKYNKAYDEIATRSEKLLVALDDDSIDKCFIMDEWHSIVREYSLLNKKSVYDSKAISLNNRLPIEHHEELMIFFKQNEWSAEEAICNLQDKLRKKSAPKAKTGFFKKFFK